MPLLYVFYRDSRKNLVHSMRDSEEFKGGWPEGTFDSPDKLLAWEEKKRAEARIEQEILEAQVRSEALAHIQAAADERPYEAPTAPVSTPITAQDILPRRRGRPRKDAA